MDTNITPPKETAKDLFLHLLSAATLYLSVIGFITLWWQYINFLFPDKLNVPGYGSSIYYPLLWATSALAVAFPVYVLISWIIGRDFRANSAKRESPVRKWLWYITLFISAMTIIIDMVTLIFNFLKGDLTTQFFLKLIVILLVTAGVFGYYLWDLKKRDVASDKPKKLAWIVGILIFLSIIYGFFLVGSPTKQRDLRFDEQRASDLQQIQGALANFWQQKNILPKTLDELNVLGYSVPADPESGQQYEYLVKGDLSFELCANFKTVFKPTNSDLNSRYYYSQVGMVTTPQNWTHEATRACFETVIDKDFFKNTINPKLQPIPAPAM